MPSDPNVSDAKRRRVELLMPALCHLRTVWAQECLHGQESHSFCGLGRFQLLARMKYLGRALILKQFLGAGAVWAAGEITH